MDPTEVVRIPVPGMDLQTDCCHKLLAKILRVILYQTGQFPDLKTLQKTNADPVTGLTDPAVDACQKSHLSRKAAEFLSYLDSMEHDISGLPPSVRYFLILFGGFANHPKTAFLVDFSTVMVKDECVTKSDNDYRSIFESMIQHPVYNRRVVEIKPTNIHIYVCAPSTFRSTRFRPKLDFRLPKHCPVLLLQLISESCHSLILDEDEFEEHTVTAKQILYEHQSDFVWHAALNILRGFKGDVY
ncbi:unnamed protein product [Calicophoron daubneyi]|uniref:Uncharacterized protein n=1 Tax=Calicophoron daubneyi TaxID=300641 RepID=A0AAV2T3M3_CALDB